MLLIRFTAMHGLAATRGDGTHHSPIALPAASDAHGIDALSMVATTNMVVTTADHLTGRRTPGALGAAEGIPTANGEHGGSRPWGGQDPQAPMAGCVIAVYGLAVLALVLPGRGTPTRESASSRRCASARTRCASATPPPRQPREAPSASWRV